MQLRTPIGKVRGLGAARDGVHHWAAQRVTAIANLLLLAWFIVSAIGLAGAGYAETRAWLASPVAASLMILLIISVCYHARLGLQVVLEDYVHHEGLKLAALIGLTFLTAALAVACIVAILKIAVGG